MLVELSASGERLLRPLWGRPAVALTPPVSLALLFLGLQCLFLNYMILVYVPLVYEPPTTFGLLDLWWYSAEHGAGIPAEFSVVNVLLVLYLWVSNRTRSRRWWNSANRFMLVGTAGLFLVAQYALSRLVQVPFARYSLQVIELVP